MFSAWSCWIKAACPSIAPNISLIVIDSSSMKADWRSFIRDCSLMVFDCSSSIFDCWRMNVYNRQIKITLRYVTYYVTDQGFTSWYGINRQHNHNHNHKIQLNMKNINKNSENCNESHNFVGTAWQDKLIISRNKKAFQ